MLKRKRKSEPVVYRSFPTSNHNYCILELIYKKLYIVRFLHQTTTKSQISFIPYRCISFVSYIKPQRIVGHSSFERVVYRSFPTSNHNCSASSHMELKLYIVRFLHQTTTRIWIGHLAHALYIVRFLHQTTTCPPFFSYFYGLYIVRFLHQTTTLSALSKKLVIVVYRSFPTSNHNGSK